MKPKFTDKQLAFMKAYIVCPNATQAAIEAGYSKKTARQQGQRLLSNVDIRAMVDKALTEIAEKQQVRAEEVIRETKLLAFSNILDYISFDKEGTPHYDIASIDRDLGAAIKSFDYSETVEGPVRRSTVRIVLHDKLKALDKLDTATSAFTKQNRDIDDGPKRTVIQVITNIPGPPGCQVRRPEPELRGS